MAERDPHTEGGSRPTAEGTREDGAWSTPGGTGRVADGVWRDEASAPSPTSDAPCPDDTVLVRIRDLAGRPRGIGFLADHEGTLLTSHEAVDGLPRLVLQAAGDRTCVVGADAVTPLPQLNLALVRTAGLDVAPLPLTVQERIDAGTYVRIAAGCWREARVLAATQVSYTATDRFHLLDDVLELAIGTAGRDALRLGGGAAGGPVLDACTGAVLGVLGTALHTAERDAGFAVPLRPADGALADLLARNAATVPAYGADLNLAGMLELTATSVAQDGPHGIHAGPVAPVERADTARELTAFTEGDRTVLGLVGAPGSGRTTELAALAARWARGERPAPTLWLRGADLEEADHSVADAARRALERAVRIVAASRSVPPEDLGDLTPEHLARLAVRTGRPLLLLLDGPEEMPPVLAHRLPEWTRGTANWLRETGTRLVVACREEYWERAGTQFPPDLLHTPHDHPDPRPTPAAATDPRPTPAAATDPRPTPAAATDPRPTPAAATDPSHAWPGHAGSSHAPADATDASHTSSGYADPTHASPAPPGHAGAHAPTAQTNPVHASAASAGRTDPPPASAASAGRTDTPPASTDSAGRAEPPDASPGSAGRTDPSPASAAPPDRRGSLPPCVRLADLDGDEARRARARYGIPDGVLAERDAGHPLTLRLLSEVRAAVPDAPAAAGPVDRHEVFAAHLDLMCLRIAVRLAAGNGLRGTAVRRLAARVAGQVHEAARRSLGPGQGELDRDAFEAVFPWGPAPARLGGGTGWASAVLTEGLLVPAGSGYRFAHEELADWIQGMHLDLDEALHALVHRPRGTGEACPVPVPHHRIGPVVQALLLLARQQGPRQLALRLHELTEALDRDPGSWWAARLLARTLLQVPDATPYTEVLRPLADRIVAWHREQRPVPAEFGPAFWTAVPVCDAERLDLLRRLVLADPAPPVPGERYLDAVARLLDAQPVPVQRQLTHWFDDERPLPATPHATVATAAQALLHTHRHGALDELTEVLVAGAHRRADELLATLAEDEPSALCRAVDRWAHDERPARRVAAVAFGLRVAPYIRSAADRELLRYAALALLARPADCTLHGGARALLVRDPHTRDRHLDAALRHFADGDPHVPPSALVPALTTHPEPVLEAFRARLRGPDAGEALRALADVTTPALARRTAALVREAARLRPETAGHVAAYVDRRLEQGPTARPVLLPLVTGLLDGGPEQVRAALATVLAAAGTPASRPLRRELLEFLFTHEQEPSVLHAVLHAAADDGGRREEEARGLVHRTGLLLVRTPEGATRFDRGLVELGRQVPGFAALMARWLTDAPDDWAAVVGPSTRRMLENLAGVRVPA
ncbi:trypsin-like peptidase domain-containing protein [Streptomyces sp. NPDC048521]|uniref:trypsin-like peptidase domain-containing protein n=1 Tax=Streptomyces sp. NPDC048521 TaxID=3365566 RepID=UPI003711DA3F